MTLHFLVNFVNDLSNGSTCFPRNTLVSEIWEGTDINRRAIASIGHMRVIFSQFVFARVRKRYFFISHGEDVPCEESNAISHKQPTGSHEFVLKCNKGLSTRLASFSSTLLLTEIAYFCQTSRHTSAFMFYWRLSTVTSYKSALVLAINSITIVIINFHF